MEKKVFNDAVHGHMEFHPLLIKVIDTPQFQRLRYIKQLGPCHFVYPSATHTSFEHSLGTCYLATKLLRALKTTDVKWFDEKDILLVSLGGLCRNLANAPLLADFREKFRRDFNMDEKELAVKIFDQIIQENNLQQEFEKEQFQEKDREFLRDLILGKKTGEFTDVKFRNRKFLYEIIWNKESGVDVDRFDYIARDSYHLGIRSSFDHSRFIQFAKVSEDKDDKNFKISLREKEAKCIYELFHTRLQLHERAYQHKTCKAIALMMYDALIMATDNFQLKIKNEEGEIEEVKLGEICQNVDAFNQFTDEIFSRILYSTDDNLKDAQQLLRRIHQRKLYRCIVEVSDDDKMKEVDEILTFHLEDKKELLTKYKTIFNFAPDMKNMNPVEKFLFYKKSEPDKPFKLKKERVSKFLPENFQEIRLRVYYKGVDKEECREIREKFKELLGSEYIQ
ncbi:DgyrCDS14884 [Dimorphilus gyrociliatus]|uniref:DgyrCDS14884 n=1 Tax=Dimorphilus gyrociliatus TaxID=2664684 RepID=A0A7I8WF79_9ANNE|nr:DgyrCDS14884 [Dimorphilus gyrociliatus]